MRGVRSKIVVNILGFCKASTWKQATKVIRSPAISESRVFSLASFFTFYAHAAETRGLAQVVAHFATVVQNDLRTNAWFHISDDITNTSTGPG